MENENCFSSFTLHVTNWIKYFKFIFKIFSKKENRKKDASLKNHENEPIKLNAKNYYFRHYLANSEMKQSIHAVNHVHLIWCLSSFHSIHRLFSQWEKEISYSNAKIEFQCGCEFFFCCYCRLNKKYRFNFSFGRFFLSPIFHLFVNAPTSVYETWIFNLTSCGCLAFFIPFFHHFLYQSPNHAVRLSKYNFSFFVHDRPDGTNSKSCLNFCFSCAVCGAYTYEWSALKRGSFLLLDIKSILQNIHFIHFNLFFFEKSFLIKLISVLLNGSDRFFSFQSLLVKYEKNRIH